MKISSSLKKRVSITESYPGGSLAADRAILARQRLKEALEDINIYKQHSDTTCIAQNNLSIT
jgi:hypothetical protein